MPGFFMPAPRSLLDLRPMPGPALTPEGGGVSHHKATRGIFMLQWNGDIAAQTRPSQPPFHAILAHRRPAFSQRPGKMPEIATITHKHNAIMDFMLANPAMKLGDVAAQFNCSQPWLSCIIHSNAFQARLADKQDAMFDALKFTLTDRMTAVAHDALSIVHTGLLASPNPDKALAVADTVLHRLGYAPQRAAAVEPVQVVNNFVVNAADLAVARASIIQATPEPQRQLAARSDGCPDQSTSTEAPPAHATSQQPNVGYACPTSGMAQTFDSQGAQAAGGEV